MSLHHGQLMQTSRTSETQAGRKWPVSVLINTYNAAVHLEVCLRSVAWAEEIIVVDMHSQDETIAIARRYTDKIYFHPFCNYCEPARETGLQRCTQPWVLIIDADEVCPPSLAVRLQRVIERDEADVVSIPHNNYFFGELMVGCRWGPLQDRHDRFFKKEAMVVTSEVHNYLHRKRGVRCLVLSDPQEGFVHFNYLDWDHFFEKFNRYTTIEAENMYDGLKPRRGLWETMYRSSKEFIGRFLKHRGYRDGLKGFVLCVAMALYPWVVLVKYRLMNKHKHRTPGQTVQDMYERMACEILDV